MTNSNISSKLLMKNWLMFNTCMKQIKDKDVRAARGASQAKESIIGQKTDQSKCHRKTFVYKLRI